MIILKYILVTLIVIGLYLLTAITHLLFNKFKKNFNLKFGLQFCSLFIFIIIYLFNIDRINLFNFNQLNYLTVLGLMTLAVIPTGLIVFFGKTSVRKLTKNDVIGAVLMEIPQRLLILNIFILIGVSTVIYKDFTLAVLLTSLVWTQFIIIPNIITKSVFKRNSIIDLIASMWFLTLLGILYMYSGNILFTMISHALQRVFTYGLLNKLFKKTMVENSMA